LAATTVVRTHVDEHPHAAWMVARPLTAL
jgi:hypothetical protein